MLEDLSKFIAGLSKSEFELFKLIVDKFVIAFLIAVGGVLVYFLLERYKSSLVKSLEMTKFHMPRVTALLEDAESLYKLGISVTSELIEEYNSYLLWETEIKNTRKKLSIVRNVPMDYTSKDFILNPNDKYPVTVYSLLYSSTHNREIQELLRDDDFWKNDNIYQADDGFIWKLNFELQYQSGILLKSAIIDLFLDNSIDIKQKYYEKLNDFRHKVMINLYTESRKQKKIAKVITMSMDLCFETVKGFPDNDAYKLVKQDISAAPTLTKCYATLLTQIKLYVKHIEKA